MDLGVVVRPLRTAGVRALGGLTRRASRGLRALAETGLDVLVVAAEGLASRLLGRARSARAAWQRRPAAVRHQLAQRASQPLANLYEEHPEARQALSRPLGLRTIMLDEICGTAVAGMAQRGGDFLPLPQVRSQNWRGRWQRLGAAVDRLAILPPIDVVRYRDCYWVVDGHNRVAAALYAGQVAIDADVTELRAPGEAGEPSGPLAASLADAWAARAAGAGRWTPAAPVVTSARELGLGTAPTHDRGPEGRDADAGAAARDAGDGRDRPATEHEPEAES